jgi:hypothetical protein
MLQQRILGNAGEIAPHVQSESFAQTAV